MRSLSTCMTVLCLVSALCGVACAENPKNLLFYGNSFTLGIGSAEAESFGGVPEVVRQLAIAAGYPPPRVENAAVSGQSLSWHLANNTAVISDPADLGELPDFQWDAVIIQEYSTKPTHIGNPAAFRADALTLFGLVRSHSPGARAVLYETWARGPGHEFYFGDPPLFPGGPAQMQQELRESYELARQDLVGAHGAGSAVVARVGDAWEATGWANLHADDIYHANTRGTYLAGLVIFGTVYGRHTTAGLPKLFNSLTLEEASQLQAVADQFLPPPPPFDYNGDDNIDGGDLPGLATCLIGPGLGHVPGAVCLRLNGDSDADVDLRDVALMQTAVFQRPPSLFFSTWDLTFTLPQGTGTETQSNIVTTSNASVPAVQLSAVDLATSAPPTWLTVPGVVSAGTAFSVTVNVNGLTPGTRYARVSASASGYDVALCTVTLLVTPAGAGQVLFFDFGDAGQQTPGNYNNVTHFQTPVANVIDSNGATTGITLTVTDSFWPGANLSGTTTPTGDAAELDPQATRDNLFGCTAEFGGYLEATAAFTLDGLNTAAGVTYTFTFFASRLGVSDNRETAYAVTGATSGVAYLDVANNVGTVAVVPNIQPDVNGRITVSLSPGPNNNNAYGFYYIGALKVVRNDP